MDALRIRAEADYRELVDNTATPEEAVRIIALALRGELKAPTAVVKRFVAKHRLLEAAVEAEIAAAAAAAEAQRRVEVEEAARHAVALSASARAAVPAYVPPAVPGDAGSELSSVRVLLEHLVCASRRMEDRMVALEGGMSSLGDRMGALEGGMSSLGDRTGALEGQTRTWLTAVQGSAGELHRGLRALSALSTELAALGGRLDAVEARWAPVHAHLMDEIGEKARAREEAEAARARAKAEACRVRFVRLERQAGEADDEAFALCGLRTFSRDGSELRGRVVSSSAFYGGNEADKAFTRLAFAPDSDDVIDAALSTSYGPNYIEVELQGGPHDVARVEVASGYQCVSCTLKKAADAVVASKRIVPPGEFPGWRTFSVDFP